MMRSMVPVRLALRMNGGSKLFLCLMSQQSYLWRSSETFGTARASFMGSVSKSYHTSLFLHQSQRPKSLHESGTVGQAQRANGNLFFSIQMDRFLLKAKVDEKLDDWEQIAKFVQNGNNGQKVTGSQCKKRWFGHLQQVQHEAKKKGNWSEEHIEKLTKFGDSYPPGMRIPFEIIATQLNTLPSKCRTKWDFIRRSRQAKEINKSTVVEHSITDTLSVDWVEVLKKQMLGKVESEEPKVIRPGKKALFKPLKKGSFGIIPPKK